MKRALIVLILFSFLTRESNAQGKLHNVLPLKDNRVTYTGVVHIDTVTKDDLYKRARKWMTFHSDNIKFDHVDWLVSTGYFEYNADDVFYKLILQIKDGRYCYELTDIKFRSYLEQLPNKSIYTEIPIELQKIIGSKGKYFETVDNLINDIIKSLNNSMKTPIDNNW